MGMSGIVRGCRDCVGFSLSSLHITLCVRLWDCRAAHQEVGLDAVCLGFDARAWMSGLDGYRFMQAVR